MPQKCPLCEARKVKRFCPAKASMICPVCCGEKREIEISCPADCVYLQPGRDYEAERQAKRTPAPARTPRLWESSSLQRYYGITMSLWKIFSEGRNQFGEIVDVDVHEAIEALLKTYRTLESGIYYEHAPIAPAAKSLYIAVKTYLDKAHQALDETIPRMKLSEILDCLQLQKELCESMTLPRPKSRAFLDHIHVNVSKAFPSEAPQSSIILP
ncbi:MAG: hypothetical protein U0V70_10695 [Terriglobia bacterium]